MAVAQSSPQVQALKEHAAQVITRLTRPDTDSLAWELYSKDLISQSTRNDILETPEAQRKSSKLVQAMENRISTDAEPASSFKAFVDVLKSVTSLTDLGERLEQRCG